MLPNELLSSLFISQETRNKSIIKIQFQTQVIDQRHQQQNMPQILTHSTNKWQITALNHVIILIHSKPCHGHCQ